MASSKTANRTESWHLGRGEITATRTPLGERQPQRPELVIARVERATVEHGSGRSFASVSNAARRGEAQ